MVDVVVFTIVDEGGGSLLVCHSLVDIQDHAVLDVGDGDTCFEFLCEHPCFWGSSPFSCEFSRCDLVLERGLEMSIHPSLVSFVKGSDQLQYVHLISVFELFDRPGYGRVEAISVSCDYFDPSVSDSEDGT